MANLDNGKTIPNGTDESVKSFEGVNTNLGECLGGTNNPEEIKYEELKNLLKQGNYNQIKEYIHNNEELRTSMHEAAHVIVGKSFGVKIGSVKIGEQNNEQGFSVPKKIGGKSSGQTSWISFLYFTAQSFIQTSLAGYMAECILGINYKEASKHANQDFYDIITRHGFSYVYEKGRKLIGFNDRGGLINEEIEPKLTQEEVKNELRDLAQQEQKTVASIIFANLDNLYKLGIEIYGKKELTDTEVDSIIKLEKPVEKI